MWCDANKWVHLIRSPDCFHSHLLPYCFVLTRKVAIKISNTHFPSQVCLPTPSIIWHPHHTHTSTQCKRTYEKIKFMIKGVGFWFSAVFLLLGGNSLTEIPVWSPVHTTHIHVWGDLNTNVKLWKHFGCKLFYCSMFNSNNNNELHKRYSLTQKQTKHAPTHTRTGTKHHTIILKVFLFNQKTID